MINNENKRFCVLNNRSFIIYGSIVCFCVPCVLMLVTYSLTIRRLQQEAAKCYSDPDDHLTMMSETSDRLRRHRSSSKVRSPTQYYKTTSLRDLSNLTTTPSASFLRSPTLLDVDNKQNHHEWA
jgi:hypothetical protein